MMMMNDYDDERCSAPRVRGSPLPYDDSSLKR